MAKYLLAFDTSAEVIVLGLARFSGGSLDAGPFVMVCDRVIKAYRQANALLLTEIDRMLEECDVDKGDISAIVVGEGPGSFTGVRIAIATAKGLALGLDVPLYGVPTSLASGYSMQEAGVKGWVLLASDAMRREIYPSLMLLGEGEKGAIRRDQGDFVIKPAAYRDELTAQLKASGIKHLSLAGSGVEKYREHFEFLSLELGIEVTKLDETCGYPSGAGLVEAHRQRMLAGAAGSEPIQSGDAAEVLPIYTRMSDAEETERQKLIEAGELSLKTGIKNSTPLAKNSAAKPVKPPQYLRLLNPSDLDAMTKLAASSNSSWIRESFEDEFELLGRAWFGFFEGATLLGYIGVAKVATQTHVLDLAVSKEHQREGIASSLIEAAKNKALGWGCAILTLEVRVSNTPAIELYKSQNFISRGERPGYYPDGENAYIMDLEIIDQQSADRFFAIEDPEKRLKIHERIMAIETSCDETAVAIIEQGEILSNTVASQIEFHARFGGVVPEIASRKHTEALVDTTRASLSEAGVPFSAVDAIAVTDSPGLIGALVVGLAFAKGLSYASCKPLYGINHLEGHIYANAEDDGGLEYPFVALVVSGGHTSLIASRKPLEYTTLGATLDDATGEAFDKVAKALGLPYPGGPQISKLALKGDPTAFDFPRAMMHSKDYAFSLSGLKTAVITVIRDYERKGEELNVPDLAASFQQAVIDVQAAKAITAVEELGAKHFLLAGGVAANKGLRQALTQAMESRGIKVSVPPLHFCTDNAAMIAKAARVRVHIDEPLGLGAEASASAPLDSI